MKDSHHYDYRNIQPDYARVYDDFRGSYSQETIRAICERANLNPLTSTVLDLACGTGAVFRELFGRAHRIVGMDAAAPMLYRARLKYPDMRLVCASGEKIPLREELFDLVTIGQAIHWFNLSALLPELLRVLKPGGWLAVLSRYPSPAGQLNALVERIRYPFSEAGKNGQPKWSTSNSPSNLLGVEQAGFVDYQRLVIPHEMELPLEGYLEGMVDRGLRGSNDITDAEALRNALRPQLEQIALDGTLREPFFDYLFFARKP